MKNIFIFDFTYIHVHVCKNCELGTYQSSGGKNLTGIFHGRDSNPILACNLPPLIADHEQSSTCDVTAKGPYNAYNDELTESCIPIFSFVASSQTADAVSAYYPNGRHI